MTSLAMIGLISTPSTWPGAEDERRHEIAAAAGADDERREARLLQLIGDGGQLVAQVLDVRENPASTCEDGRRRRRVDVHVARVGQRAGVGRAERPVAVRALVDADARERIPLAEEHRVALTWPFVSRRRRRRRPTAGRASATAMMPAPAPANRRAGRPRARRARRPSARAPRPSGRRRERRRGRAAESARGSRRRRRAGRRRRPR